MSTRKSSIHFERNIKLKKQVTVIGIVTLSVLFLLALVLNGSVPSFVFKAMLIIAASLILLILLVRIHFDNNIAREEIFSWLSSHHGDLAPNQTARFVGSKNAITLFALTTKDAGYDFEITPSGPGELHVTVKQRSW